MIAIDVGCSPKGGDSIGLIIRENRPERLYGFDPSPAVEPVVGDSVVDGVPVHVEPVAAWTYDGELHWIPYGYGTVSVENVEGSIVVPCIDLARFIVEELPPTEPILLKLDCEGGEYRLLPHLLDKGLGERLEAVWIEWHMAGADDPLAEQARLTKALPCPVWSWNL